MRSSQPLQHFLIIGDRAHGSNARQIGAGATQCAGIGSMRKQQSGVSMRLSAEQLNRVLLRLDTHHSICQKAYAAILVKADWTRPEIIFADFSCQVILKSGAIIHGERVISDNSDFRSSIFVPQDFGSRRTSNAITYNQIGLPCCHWIAPVEILRNEDAA